MRPYPAVAFWAGFVQSSLVQWHLKNGWVAVLGGAEVALARLRLVQDSGAECRVYSDAPSQAVVQAAERGELQLLPLRAVGGAGETDEAGGDSRGDAPGQGPDLVFCVPEPDVPLEELARRAAVWDAPCNVLDMPELSDFLVPALVRRPPLQVALGSGGASPLAVKLARERVEAALPSQLGRLAAALGRWREQLPAGLEAGEAGRRLRLLAEGGAGQAALAGEHDRADRLAGEAIAQGKAAQDKPVGLVQIVGAGPGGSDTLTLGAMRAMASCDVLVHDRLVSPDILELARADARRIDVGKAAGGKGWKQPDINRLLVQLGGEGARVCRLKGGDPGVFGRLEEELRALAGGGIPFEVIPGVSAAMAAAAWTGVPLTHRGHAHLCVLVTGHTGKEADDPPWETLAKLPGTLALYMGLYRLHLVAQRLQDGGLDPQTPAAAVSRGGTDRQRILTAPLAELAGRVQNEALESPVLVLIGPAVAPLA